jgi:hypothetical protein
MFDDLPALAYREDFRFRGVLRGKHVEFPIEAIIVSRWKYRHPSEITFSFEYSKADQGRVRSLFLSAEAVEFVGIWEYHGKGVLLQPPSSRLLLTSATSESAGRMSGRVEEMVTNDADLPATPGWQRIVAWITPMPIAFTQNSKWDAGPPFEVPTRFGEFKLVRGHEPERALVEGVRAEVSVPRVFMYLDLPADQRTPKVGDLMRGMAEEIRGLELVLSFLSRRHVSCYRVTVYSAEPKDEGPISEANRYVQSFATPGPPEELVEARAMKPDAIAGVLRHLGQSPYKEPIRHTLNFLLSYWSSDYAENQISAAFTAFETIVNGIGEVRGDSKTLDDPTFEELQERLQASIKEFAKEKGLDSSTRKRLYEKLGELQRPAISPRAAALVEEHEVSWRDLWRVADVGSLDLQRELAQAYGRRSVLVHAGRVEDYGALLSDAARVHALAERLLFRLLGAQPEWLGPFAYRYV